MSAQVYFATVVIIVGIAVIVSKLGEIHRTLQEIKKIQESK